ncbi:MAG: sulfatase [Phycisphaerae bacterium]
MRRTVTRRTFLRSLAASAAGAAAAATGLSCRARAAEPTRKPNVLFILADDLGWKDLGCFGSTFYETPHVDGLRATGMMFTDAYAACPVCSPTRASIMAGKYPARTGVTDYINPAGRNQPEQWRRNTRLLPAPYRDRLTHNEVTLAEALKQAGYATFFAGKWHLGPEGFWPEDQGFDVNEGGIERGGPYGGKKYFSPYGNPRLADGPPGEHLPLRLGRETADFIEAHREEPFLAYLSFYSVHTPLMTTEALRDKYRAKAADAPDTQWGREGERKVRLVQNHAVYAGMVEAMDTAVGIVLERLERLGLADDTVVFFMSDNGGLATSEGHPTANVPLRAGKGWLYEGGIREPMLVRVPGLTRPGSVCTEPVISTDFYPTILDLAGLPLRPEQHTDGVSLRPLLEGRPMDRGPLFWHYPHYGNQGGAPGGAVRDGPWKLIEWYEDGRLELYHLRDDPGETRDLAAAHPDRAKDLHAKLVAWREATGAKMPTVNQRYEPGKPRR